MTRPVIVVGAGVAGLSAAVAMARAGQPVVVVTKAEPPGINTFHAQGGIAAALWPDTAAEHAADTLRVARGLGHPAAVAVLTESAPAAVAELMAGGVLTDESNGVDRAQEAGHSRPRVLHAKDGFTGRAVWHYLARVAKADERIRWITDQVVALCGSDSAITGVYLASRETIAGRGVVLASGGYAGLYPWSTNPDTATGDGLWLAYQVGAQLADLEFVQFHPTVLKEAGRPPLLLTEALRGAGAWLVDEDEQRILADHPWGELAPRDEVAKAVWRTARAYLTAAHLGPGIRKAFPALAEALAERGWDLARDRLPVRPAAHFAMGGIVTDLWGATGVPGLWAVGEVAASGVHGANRLASNSLLEGRVFGLRVAEAVLGAEGPSSDKCGLAFAPPDPAFWIPTSVARQTLDQALGVIRTQTTLEDAQNYPWHAMGHLSDWLTGLMLEAAVKRQESRGAHCRDDYPATDDRWRGHLVHQKGHPLKLVPIGK